MSSRSLLPIFIFSLEPSTSPRCRDHSLGCDYLLCKDSLEIQSLFASRSSRLSSLTRERSNLILNMLPSCFHFTSLFRRSQILDKSRVCSLLSTVALPAIPSSTKTLEVYYLLAALHIHITTVQLDSPLLPHLFLFFPYLL
jgi:hypothetical protein